MPARQRTPSTIAVQLDRQNESCSAEWRVRFRVASICLALSVDLILAEGSFLNV